MADWHIVLGALPPLPKAKRTKSLSSVIWISGFTLLNPCPPSRKTWTIHRKKTQKPLKRRPIKPLCVVFSMRWVFFMLRAGKGPVKKFFRKDFPFFEKAFSIQVSGSRIWWPEGISSRGFESTEEKALHYCVSSLILLSRPPSSIVKLAIR